MSAFKPVLILGICLLAASVPVVAESGGLMSGGQDLSLAATQVESVVTGRDLNLSGTTVDGGVVAGGRLDCRGCSISGSASAGRDVVLNDCTRVQNVSSGGDALLTKARVFSNITAGGSLAISDSMVDQNATAGRQITLSNSIIQGDLSLGGHYMKLDHSQARAIRFSGTTGETTGGGIVVNGGSSGIINSNSSVISNAIIGNGNVIARGGSMVSVGAGGMSSVNGYMVSSTGSQTTLVTPGQTVYVNGRKVSGEGPVHYGDYRSEMPGAPVIKGPGWPAELAEKKIGQKQPDKSKIVVNTLEVMNNSTIRGDVVFESGYGKVKLQPGSTLMGKVVNGTVERVE